MITKYTFFTGKLLHLLLCIVFPAFSFSVAAQQQLNEQQGAKEAEINADPHPQDTEDRQTHDPEGNYEGNTQSNVPANAKVINEGNKPSNTAGANVSTSSSSGSPGVPMEGKQPRDGTNTMQKASLNIAGSPVPKAGSNKGKDTGDNKKQGDVENAKTNAPAAEGGTSKPSGKNTKRGRNKKS
jgi:hypothetical protein